SRGNGCTIRDGGPCKHLTKTASCSSADMLELDRDALEDETLDSTSAASSAFLKLAKVDPDEAGDLALRVSRVAEHLNRVPLEHVDHPFPRCPGGAASVGSEGVSSKRPEFPEKGRSEFPEPALACLSDLL